MKISKNLSFKGYDIKMWADLNKIEILKVAGVIAGTVYGVFAGAHPIITGLVGLALKFGLDGVHYFFDNQIYFEEEDYDE
jgi:uncharacterized membrane protein